MHILICLYTKHHGHVGNFPVLYLRFHRFISQSRAWLFWLRFSWSSSNENSPSVFSIHIFPDAICCK
jgi:hypothetical protein